MKAIKLAIFLLFTAFLSNSLAQERKAIDISYQQTTEGYVFYGVNNTNVPMYLKFQFSQLKNLSPNKELNTYFPTLYPKQEAKVILTLVQQETDKSSSFNFNYIYTIGDPSLEPSKDHLYWLPYKHGKRVRVAQGNNGTGTHKGLNAIDFNLEVGDTVFAARDGFVYEVKEDSNKGGNNLAYDQDGNFINVYHADGTLGKYVHLKKNGAMVSVGEQIKAGQAIGLSGNTGYSSGPHLHFAVIHNLNFEPKSLAVKFIDYQEQAFIPQEGRSYYAYHPGKGSFEVEDASTFNESRLEQEVSKSTINKEIKIESTAYGDYTLLYVNNGFDHAIEGELIVNLHNMEASKKLPYSFTVEAKTKKYLLAISPQDNAAKYSFELSASFKR